MKKKLIMGGIALLAVLAVVPLGGDPAPDQADETAAVEEAPEPEAEPEAEALTPAPQTDEAFGEGDWIIGTDLEPGRYVIPGAEDGALVLCVVDIKDADAGFISLDSSDAVDSRIIVDVPDSPGGIVSLTGCQPMTALEG